jgi:ribonuclease-3
LTLPPCPFMLSLKKAMDDLDKLQKILGISFKDRSLLEQALVHTSYINENPALNLTSNERLEFFGDAILSFIIAQELYQRFPGLSEGEMTKLRSSVVRREALARTARTIRLGDYLYLGKGEEASGGRRKPATLASTLEAIIAAIFLDQGLASTRDFVLRATSQELNKRVEVDYKSQLQELLQARRQLKPTYKVVAVAGPDHDRTFTVEVRVGNNVLGRGSGKSKKAAETEAARSTLAKLPANFTP